MRSLSGRPIPRLRRHLPCPTIHLTLQLRLVEEWYDTGKELPFTVLKENQCLAIPQLTGKNGTKPHAAPRKIEARSICLRVAVGLPACLVRAEERNHTTECVVALPGLGRCLQTHPAGWGLEQGCRCRTAKCTDTRQRQCNRNSNPERPRIWKKA